MFKKKKHDVLRSITAKKHFLCYDTRHTVLCTVHCVPHLLLHLRYCTTQSTKHIQGTPVEVTSYMVTTQSTILSTTLGYHTIPKLTGFILFVGFSTTF